MKNPTYRFEDGKHYLGRHEVDQETLDFIKSKLKNKDWPLEYLPKLFGKNLLIKMEGISDTTEGGILLPETYVEGKLVDQCFGTLIAASPGAWCDIRTGEPYPIYTNHPVPGSRICFCKFHGQGFGVDVPGFDREWLTCIDDHEMVCEIDHGSELTVTPRVSG